jgi:YbbR domain-containing protein
LNWKSSAQNWSIKVGAFLIGVLLWAHVKTDQRYESVINLPLEVSESSGRYVVANEIPETVEILVRGTGKDLLFQPKHGRVVLRPRISRREAVTVDISLENIEGIDVVNDIELLGVESPRSVVLDFDYLETREVDIISRVNIEVEPGYTVVGDPLLSPATVRIGGPRQYVRQISSVTTDSVTLQGITNDVSLTVPISLRQDWNLTSTPEDVTVAADVQVLLERRMRDVPVSVARVPRGVEARAVPGTVTIDLVGGADAVSSLDAAGIRAVIDYRLRFSQGLDDLPIEVVLPEHVRLVRAIPDKASLVVSERSRRR